MIPTEPPGVSYGGLIFLYINVEYSHTYNYAANSSGIMV
jgi:hypothetical protein